MRIAVCDSKKESREWTGSLVTEVCPKGELIFFSSGEELLLSEKPVDILFLEICLSGKNGMDIARELRRRGRRDILIFITERKDRVFQAFDVGAFHYLVKPVKAQRVKEVLKRAIEEYDLRNPEEEQEPGCVVVTSERIHITVKLSDIVYAEVFNRKIVLYKLDSELEYYGKMSELEQAAGDSFFRSHRSYLVNFKYVEKYDATEIYLQRGTALMAKKKYEDFVKQYQRYRNKILQQKKGISQQVY